MCAPPPRSAPGLGVRTPTRCPWCVPGSDRVSLGGPLTWRNRPFACDRPQRRLSHVTPGPLAWVEVGHPRGGGSPKCTVSACEAMSSAETTGSEGVPWGRGFGEHGRTRLEDAPTVLGPEPRCVGWGERVGWGREVAARSMSARGLQVRPAPRCPWEGIPGPQLPGTLCYHRRVPPQRDSHPSCPCPTLTPYRSRAPEGAGLGL